MTTTPSDRVDRPGSTTAGPASDHARRRLPNPFDRPVFVVGAPCSGAEQLTRALAASPDLQHLDAADPLAPVERLHPAERGWDTCRLAAPDAKPQTLAPLAADWVRRLGAGADGVRPRFVATWPAAALQVPFLARAFPDARFVYVQRDVTESLVAMLRGWRAGDAVAHPDLPCWDGPPWSYLLTPEWRKLDGADLPTIVADQWRKTTETIVADLGRLPAGRRIAVGHREWSADPGAELARLAEFLRIDVPPVEAIVGPATAAPVPTDAELAEITTVLAPVGDIASRSRELVTRPPADEGAEASPFRSSSTTTFAELLDKLGSSLLISTYQTGRLVLARVADGKLNTHFRTLESPMGVAYRPGMLSVGTKSQVWTYTDLPDLAPTIEPAGRHDACFVPRSTLFTGNIRIHDVAWAGGELWAVATRFSCLVTFDGRHNFVPRWKPPFITELRPEDRCHLNGLAVVDDRVRYVTALGTTDTEGGWRPDKASGGVIMDVDSGEVVVGGLSMPHSPRWYRDQLWVLESGEGGLCRVDLDAGTVETVAQLPGFTRGIAFAGRYAFVGLSEVREATTFGGLPLTSRLENRECGVWVVDLVTGQTMGFLRFEDAVQEIFDVVLLPGMRFPEILDPGSELIQNAFAVPQGPGALGRDSAF